MSTREPITFRIPREVLAAARTLRAEGESLNDVAVKALRDEVRRRQALAAHASIVRRRAEVRRRTGAHPEVAGLIRGLRSGESRDE